MSKQIKTIEEIIAKLQELVKQHPGIEVLCHSDEFGEFAIHDIEYRPEGLASDERIVFC